MIISTNLAQTILLIFQGVTTRSLIPISMPFPYRWNSLQNNFYVSNSYPSWWWKVVGIIHITAAFLQAIFQKITPDKSALWELILRAYFISLSVLLTTCFTAFHKFQAPSVCEYLNKLIQFEKRHVHASQHKKWQNLETKLISFLALSFDLSVRALNVLIPIITVILPKSPWNSYSSLYVLVKPSIPTTPLTKHLIKITIFIANYFFFRVIMDSVVMCYAVNFMISVYGIKCCLKVFGQMSTNSVFLSTFKAYREIQVLTSLYNVTHRNTCMVGIVVVTIISSVTFSYMALGNFRELHPIMLLACVLLTCTANAQILLSFQLPTQVYTTCITIHKNLDKYLLVQTKRDKKWMMRFWISCPVMKVEFFGNYFDDLTSLVILKFCVDATINLILLKK